MAAKFFLHIILACLLVIGLFLEVSPAAGANFTRGADTAQKFGVHEIAIKSEKTFLNPFDVAATVKFIPPSGETKAVTVNAFYDGKNIWRARVYITEIGTWLWKSACVDDSELDGKSGTFAAISSPLKGMLRKHKFNPKAWMTDDGEGFINIGDTGYKLFNAHEILWQEFVRDSVAQGVTSLRAASLGGWGDGPDEGNNDYWSLNDPWEGSAFGKVFTRYDLTKFQNTDNRLVWLLDNFPDLYIQFILFGLKGYGVDDTGEQWFILPQSVRNNTMRYMLARWGAFPQLFWLIVNDMHCSPDYPKNQAFAREVGNFFVNNDPWKHLLSVGLNRFADFPFITASDLKWISYIHIETGFSCGADEIHKFDVVPLHVYAGEDYYEQDFTDYVNPAYYFRWLFWSWIMSGGSSNYAGRYGVIHPYSQTWRPDLDWSVSRMTRTWYWTGKQLTGLNTVPYLLRYFTRRNLDIGQFLSNDGLVNDLDGRADRRRPKLMRRGSSEFLVYHPNSASEKAQADLERTKTVQMRIDLRDTPGKFQVEWYRPEDGVVQNGEQIEGGDYRKFVAPWQGCDVVLRLRKFGDKLEDVMGGDRR